MTTRPDSARSISAPPAGLTALVLLALLAAPLLATPASAQEASPPAVTLTPVDEVLAASAGGRATFRFHLNHTGDTEEWFNLLAEGPTDAVSFFLTGNTSPRVGPGETIEVELAAVPRENAPAGRHVLTLTATPATPGNPGARAQVLLLTGPAAVPYPDTGKWRDVPPPGTLEGEVSLQFVSDTVRSTPDGLATFDLLVHNPSNRTRYVLLNVTAAAEGLALTYSPARILVLAPGARGEAQVAATLPAGAANGSYGFTLEAQVPQSALWYTLTTLRGNVLVGDYAPGTAFPGYTEFPVFDPDVAVNVSVQVENETQQVEAGNVATVTVNLTNHGTAFERMRVEWSEETGTLQPFIPFIPERFLPPGGNASIPLTVPTSPYTRNGTYVLQITVSSAANASRFLQHHAAEVTVVNSTGAPPFTRFTPNGPTPPFGNLSRSEPMEIPQDLQLGVAPPAPVTLEPEGAAPMRTPDGRYVIPYRVRNDGTAEDSFSLEVFVLPALEGTVRNATVDPDRLVLAPGAASVVTASFELSNESAVWPPGGVVLLARSKDPQYGPVSAPLVLHSPAPVLGEAISVTPEGPAAPTEGSTGIAVAAGVGTVGLAGVAALLLRRENVRYLVTAPLVPLYTRLAKAQVLDHDTRDRILAAIKENPGVNYSTLKKDMALNAGALVHHLRTLERHQLIVSRREGPYRRFYPVGKRLPDLSRPPLTPTQARILALVPPGGVTQKLIAERAGLTQQGANYHVKSLERNGYVVIRFNKGEWRVHPVLALESTDPYASPGAGEAAGTARP